MKLRWSPAAWEDYEHWRKTDAAVWKHINALIKQTQLDPFTGLGRPKALQLELKGWWSREITNQDRLVYRVGRTRNGRQFLYILQCRGHY
jgi:toxin YoeB